MGSILDATILHHVCIVLALLWFLNSYYYCHPVAYFLSLIYLYLVHEGYVTRLRKKLQFEEKRDSNQRRVLSDSESVRWLNHTVEKIWPICMEEIVSQKILLPMIPWFLQKYKPWTVKEIEVQQLYLGRAPPIITEMRVLPNSSGDDHLVLELGMNFRTAEDMSAILGVKLTKRLGFGMWTKLHLLGMHVEGKVLVGVKFLNKWPFVGRLRVCFVVPPYFQMTVKPIFTHGLDVTELPGIAGWIDNLLGLVFEQTLVEPNMLVVDMEKFVAPQPENWFTVDAKDPIAHAIVEVLEAVEMIPSDLNGLADPYVKGQLGPYRFRTKTQKKTLTPKWREEFKIPICTWESQNILNIQVRDKDHLYDDLMGDCSVNINEFRDGQRHDIWLPLKNVKMGRLRLAVTVSEVNMKVAEPSNEAETPTPNIDYKSASFAAADYDKKDSFSSRTSEKSPKSPKLTDMFEPIDIQGQSETGIWIHHPGSEVSQVWEPRKGKHRPVDSLRLDGQVCNSPKDNTSTSTDESVDGNKPHSKNPLKKGLKKIGSVFHRSSRTEDNSALLEEDPDPSMRYNIKAVNSKKSGVNLILSDINDPFPPSLKDLKEDDDKESLEESGLDSPHGGHVKEMAKNIFKKSARGLKNVLSRKESKKSRTESELSLEDKLEMDSGNNSFKSEASPIEMPRDISLQTSKDSVVKNDESRRLSIDEINEAIRGSAVTTNPSGNNKSFKSEDCNIETPRDISMQTSKDSVVKNNESLSLSVDETNQTIRGSAITTNRPGNNSFKSEDCNIETPRDISMQTSEDSVVKGSSGNNSFKSEASTIERPRDISVQGYLDANFN